MFLAEFVTLISFYYILWKFQDLLAYRYQELFLFVRRDVLNKFCYTFTTSGV